MRHSFLPLMVLFSCSVTHSRPDRPGLEDLRFGEYERDAIVRAEIDSSYGFSAYFPYDLEELMTYDEGGLLLRHFENGTIYDYSYSDGVRDCIFSSSFYEPDSGTDVSQLSYRFDEDSLLLYEYGENSVMKYEFHLNGLLKRKVSCNKDTCLYWAEYNYLYDDEWRLTSAVMFDVDSIMSSRLMLYYSPGGLDSTQYEMRFAKELVRTIKTVYDERGLRLYQLTMFDPGDSRLSGPYHDSVVWKHTGI